MSLEVAKLSRRFGNKWVLRDVSFRVDGGGVFGICGGTGAGKSALLSAIAGVGKTSGGTISFNGDDLAGMPGRNRPVSLLAKRKRSTWSGIFGDGSESLSNGEAQLGAFEAFVSDAPGILLLDEPFCHIDKHLRDKCFDVLRRAARARDRVVVFASSDFDQIAAVADTAAILAGGDVLQTGTPQELYDEPETVEAARTTGENNFFAARRLSSSDADLPEFHTIDGGHRIYVQKTGSRPPGAINQNMTLAIRPEQISMSIGSSFPEDNLLRAVVTGIRFLGATSLIEFEAAGLKLRTRVFKVVGLNIGDECMLGLPPHRIRILQG